MALKIEGSFADHQSADDDFGANILDFAAILELNEVRVNTVPAAGVKPDGNPRFDGSIGLEAPSNEVVGGNRRVVADLLQVNRAAIDVALIGLPQNRVKRLLHMDTQDVFADYHRQTVFHSLQGVAESCSLLHKDRSIRVALG